MRTLLWIVMAMTLMAGCSAGKAADAASDSSAPQAEDLAATLAFNADSAYAFVAALSEFGPRVPNMEAHRRAGAWLASRLRSFGWDVTEQQALLTAFDGTPLQARNIMGQLNPEKPHRLLLLAHWDSRPWADNDPDPAKRTQPVPGANDGASGVGVLLELARILAAENSQAAVDILFVDAEDWGAEHDEDSWALGTRYFAEHPPVEGYRPEQAILLDMVGSPDARFGYEYFSQEANPALLRKVWSSAASLGLGKWFHTGFGGAVTDDHVQLIEHGIPAIDIIDYRYSDSYQGFDPAWHTTHDTIDRISAETLGAVGKTLEHVIKNK